MAKQRGIGIKRLTISGQERAEFGCIVTFSDGITRHFYGKTRIEDAVKFADQLESKIITISTPETIYRDLQGTRRSMRDHTRRTQDMLTLPELTILATIGRADLL